MMISIPTDQRRTVLFLFLITIGGFCLRMYHLDFQSLWFDEIRTFIRVNGDLAHTFETLSVSPFPPLYYVVMNLWCRVFGYSELSLRFPSLIFSTLSIPLIFYLAKSMFGEREGTISALLLCVSVYSINYAQEAKMYAMLWFLCIGAFLFFFLFVNSGKNKHLILYFIFSLLSSYTLYTGFIFLIVQNMIYFTLYRKRIQAWLMTNLLILVCYIPWWYTAFFNITNKSGIGWVGRKNYGRFFNQFFSAVIGLEPSASPIVEIEYFLSWTLVVLALFYLYLLLLKPSAPSKNYISLFMWPCISIAIFVFTDLFVTNILMIRYLGFLHIPAVIILAVGICFLSSISSVTITTSAQAILFRPLKLRVVSNCVILFIVVTSVFLHVFPYHQKSLKRNGENWKGIISELCREAGPNDAVFISVGAKEGFSYYGNCFKGRTFFIPWSVVLTDELIKEKFNYPEKTGSIFILYRSYSDFMGRSPNFLKNYTIIKNGAPRVDFMRIDFN